MLPKLSSFQPSLNLKKKIDHALFSGQTLIAQSYGYNNTNLSSELKDLPPLYCSPPFPRFALAVPHARAHN
jgi:hypothetical protein